MKKVLLLGDSIRMGYDDYVKEELKECEVYYDKDDNGRFIAYTIWMFNNQNNNYGPFDVVHFNTGYWDMNREAEGEPETLPEEYIHGLKKLIRLIRKSGATPVFALTTPIYDTEKEEDGYQVTNYKNSWVKDYNEIALKVMEEENVQVNDLYSLLLDGKRYYKCPDSLHLIEDGYKKCAIAVASAVRKALKA